MMTSAEAPLPSGLRRECLSFREVLAQSIANIAPTATPTVTISLVFASAGNGMWLAYLIATIGLVLVGISINQFARRSASPGSLYSYVVKGLGPTAGVVCGCALVVAYLLTAMAVLCGFANYGHILLTMLGIEASPVVLFALCAGLAWLFAYKDIQLSAVLMLGLEALSVTLILALSTAVLFKHGFKVDAPQLSLVGVSSEGIRLGMVLAVFSYVGFESATALGDEAKSPLRTIPRSVLLSTALAGLFFIFTSYVEVLAFRGAEASLDKSDAPLNAIADLVGVGFFGPMISVGATFSFFACTLASINAAARVLFMMARHGIFHRSMGRSHSANETPHVAVSVSSVLVFLVPAAIYGLGEKMVDIYGYLGTIATYGFLLTYMLIAVAAPVYLRREKAMRPVDVAVAVASVLFMAFPVVGSVYPVPPAPYSWFPYLFVGILMAGVAWFLARRRRSPLLVQEMQSEVDANHEKFNELRPAS